MAASAVRRGAAPILDASHKQGLQSLLSQTYGKPVELNFTKLQRPHYDADVLAQVVVQRLKDRKNQPRRVIRDATWKAKLPSSTTLAKQRQETQQRNAERPQITLASLTHTPAPTSSILKDLDLSTVSSVQVSAAGRLSKRITANRAQGKIARVGATAKGETHWLRGARKSNVDYAVRHGKRRIGGYGVKVYLGHS